MLSLNFIPDEEILATYDIFGPDFWRRVHANTDAEIKPLQQEIAFAGKQNPMTMRFEFEAGEEERARSLLAFMEKILSGADYKFTPFLAEAGSAKVRYTFQPSSTRFIFQPSSMPVLAEIGHKGQSLSAMRELAEILGNEAALASTAAALREIGTDIAPTFAELKAAIREHLEEMGSDETLARRFSQVLEGAPGCVSLQHAVDAMKKAIEDDPVLITHQRKLLLLESLQPLLRTVVGQLEREATEARAEREQLLRDMNAAAP